MFRVFLSKIKGVIFRPEVLFFFIIIIFELFHVRILFGNAELLAGGDNYTYLQLGKRDFNFYTWDTSIPLGGRNYTLANLLGLPFYSAVFGFISAPLLQKLLIFSLYFLKYVGFFKLVKFLSRKFSIFALLPAILLVSFNAFESLNPFSLYPLMYGAYLPFSLYFFIKLFESERFNFSGIVKLLVLSVVFSPLNSNLALSSTIFIPQVLYILLNVKKLTRAKVANVAVFCGLFVIVNLWWIIPLALYFFDASVRVFKVGWFSPVSVGALRNNFRFIGQWGWYGKHFLYAYYPFSAYYDLPLVLLSGYLLVVFAFLAGFRKRVFGSRFRIFFLALSLFSLFLIGGARPPFGFIYGFLFNYFPGFKIFREPFTKFGELYVLAISVLFYFALLDLERRLHGKRKFLVFMFVLLLVLINAKPILLGEHVWDKWNGSVRTTRVQIPTYWKEFEKYQRENLKDTRILTVPKSYYGGAWNWPLGFSSADDVAVNFVGNGNSILRNPLNTGSASGEVIDAVFSMGKLPLNYLSLLGVDYVLRENDMDWRYSGDLTLPPSGVDKFIENLGLERVATFGEFDTALLNRIPNADPRKGLRVELGNELMGRPVLELYKVPEEYVLPKFYIPSSLVYVVGEEKDLPYVLNFPSYDRKVGIILDNESVDVGRMMRYSDIIIFGKRRYSKFSVANLSWEKGWAWPVTVNFSPEAVGYPLVRFKEFISTVFISNPLDRADALLWLAAKRVSEVTKYNVNPIIKRKLVDDYIKLVSEVVRTLKGIPEERRVNEEGSEEDYWGMVGKVLKYVERSDDALSLFDYTFDEEKDPRIIYEDFVDWVYNVSTPVCGETCYSISVPGEGKYSIYINLKEPFKSGVFTASEFTDLPKIKGFAIEREGDWYKEGITNFDEAKTYIVNLKSKSKNLLSSGDWLIPTEVDYNAHGLDFILQGTFPGYHIVGRGLTDVLEEKATSSLIMWGGNLRFKPVEDFVGGEEYKVSFEYSIDPGGLVVSLVESNSPYSGSPIADQLLLSKTLVKAQLGPTCIKNTINLECWRQYGKIVRASENAKSAFLYVYAYPDVEQASRIKIRNIKVERIVSPVVALRELANPSSEEVNIDNQPALAISKVNPTKYKVSVNGARGPYNLIFNESYDSCWKLYLDGKPISESDHYMVNGYANLWHIRPEDTDSRENYELIVEFYPQRIFIICVVLSVSTLLIAILYCVTVQIVKFSRRIINS